MKNWSDYPIIGPAVRGSGKNYQTSIPIGMFAQTLGLPGEFVTGNTLTTRIRFAPNSNEMINAALYGSPSLGHAAV